MNILLACHGGFSTSMLVKKMEESASKKKLNLKIRAVPVDDIHNHEKDIVLLGPQIAHQIDALKEELKCPVYIIDSYDYGTMNGENVLEFVIDKLGGK